MKASTLFTTIFFGADIATAIKYIAGPEGWGQSMGFNVTNIEENAHLRARQLGGAAKTVLKNRVAKIPNAKSVKVRYGPFTVPGGGANGGEGMIWNQPSPSITKPCSDCMIIGMNAGLEYPDGTDANTDTKMWLHHMVLFNIGVGAWDATCTTFGLPHMIVGSLPASSERIFSSGNERTSIFMNPPWSNSTKLSGYPVYPADRFGLITDLMNMNPGSKTVYLTMYYDFVDGHPSNYEEIKPAWFDLAQCGISEVGGGSPGSKFDVKALAWNANFEGEILHAGGHLHDGGFELDLVVDGKVICRSMPTYGSDQEALIRSRGAIRGEVLPLPKSSPAAAPASAAAPAAPAASGAAPAAPAASGAAGGHSHGGSRHIIAMSTCSQSDPGFENLPVSPLGLKTLKKGQSWTLRAYYDYNKNAGMKKGNTQKMSTVMGISIMYVKTTVKRKA